MNQKLHVASKGVLFFFLVSVLIFMMSCYKREAALPADEKSNLGGSNQPLMLPEIYVNDVGANGTDALNDTWAFQKAIDSMAALGGGIVRVRTGNYYIDADTTIRMKNNVTLYMYDTTRKLIVRPTASTRYHAILVEFVDNVSIFGGRIVGDRDIHTGTTGEWGMGIAIYGSTNVKVNRTYISNCWGDGVVVGGRKNGGVTVVSRDVILKRVTSTNNRRQALTIGGVNGLEVDSCVLTYTNGTAPQDGIDIEPDSDTAQYVYIKNCEIAHNVGNGVEMNAKTTTTAKVRNIFVTNNYMHNNAYSNYILHVQHSTINNNRFSANRVRNQIYAKDTANCVFVPNTIN
ncbi:right-handed parallel beta-helix repeat-containing protein [Chitinophaga lutea]|uniref:Right-handed parallel beta-helix repeat-containing protein n=2 Tax=Chitinophaga lutea TaxID=2488634 RepID=A0A3N4PNH0_9BACT|nr:right-handed parallel beta-helix repeat-containing protein [Chitinophaga lutea]